MIMTSQELRHARRKLGLTQQQLADKLGLTRVFIGMMERGERAIEKRTALSVLYLLRDENEKNHKTHGHTDHN